MAGNQFPATYGDGVFPKLNVVVARMDNVGEMGQRINTRMASIRQSIEHLFALHHNLFGLFNDATRFKLLVSGEEARRLIFNSFLILNCYMCFNKSMGHFMVRPPPIEDYLPLFVDYPPAPGVPDDLYVNVYRYQ